MITPSCVACGTPAGPGEWRCRCGGLFELPAMALAPLRLPHSEAAGLWRYEPWLAASRVPELSMGEGQTPLLTAGSDLPEMHLKLEFVSPSGSFKDRGAVVLVAAAVHRGAKRLIADSSGNAGSAIAAYAARARLPCTVFVPQATSAGKQRQIEAYGASLERVLGDRTATTMRAIAAVESTGSTYASHVYDPYFFQGTKTFAFEVWEQLGRVPDAMLIPVGNGTLLLGAARGFAELRSAGLTDRLPALIALQSERCAPLAAAFARGLSEAAPVRAESTVAEGIAIPRPPRGAQILAAVRESGGCVITVPEAAIAPAASELARRGLLVEPTAALVWAAALLARGLLDRVPVKDEGWRTARALAAGTVVVPLCGSGLKGDLVP